MGRLINRGARPRRLAAWPEDVHPLPAYYVPTGWFGDPPQRLRGFDAEQALGPGPTALDDGRTLDGTAGRSNDASPAVARQVILTTADELEGRRSRTARRHWPMLLVRSPAEVADRRAAMFVACRPECRACWLRRTDPVLIDHS
jgi:hypothetical protein